MLHGRPVAVLGGVRIPFCRQNTAYNDVGNLGMSVRTLDSLTVSVDGTAMLYVALGLLAVMLVCVAVACMPMLRKSPRDLSEIR